MLDHASWHMIFVVAAVYAVRALAPGAVRPAVASADGHHAEVDYLGTIAFAPAIAAVLLGINKSGAWVGPTSRPWV